MQRFLLNAALCVLAFSAGARAGDERLVAMVDVFSGMPNPRIVFQEGEAGKSSSESAILELLARACDVARSPAEASRAYPARSGYRGVLLFRQVGQDSYRLLGRLHGGTLELQEGLPAFGCEAPPEAGKARFVDNGSELEKSIVEEAFARGQLPEALLQEVLKALARNANPENPK